MALETEPNVMDPEQETKMRKRSWFAWLQSVAGFSSQIVASTATNTYTICVALIATQLGCTAADLAIASSPFGATYAGFSWLWGNLADRIGIRWSISLSPVWVGIGFILISLFTNSIMSFAILCALAGVGMGGVSGATLSKAIGSWYDTNWRGKGMILVNMGGNAASTIMGIATPILIASGWQGAYRIMGIAYLCCGVLNFILFRDSPAAIGTVPFGSPKGTMPAPYEKKAQMSPQEKAALKKEKNEATIRCLKDPMTWKFGIIYAFWQLQMNSNKAFMVAAVVAAGIGDVAFGGGLMAGFSFAMLFGQPIISFLGDYLPRKYVFGSGVLAAGLCFVAIWFAFGAGNAAALPPIYSVLGFVSGTVGISWVMMAESFPPNMRGTGPGVVSTFGIIGRVGGPLLAAFWINTFFGGDTASYVLFAAVCMLIAGALIFLWLPKTSGKYGDPLAAKYYKEHPEEAPEGYFDSKKGEEKIEKDMKA